MKKLSSILLALLMSVSVIASPAFAEETVYSEGYFHYVIRDSSIIITDYFGSEEEVTVPNMIGGYPVNAIAPGVFTGSGVEVINLPDTIMYVADGSTGNATVHYDWGDAQGELTLSPDGTVVPSAEQPTETAQTETDAAEPERPEASQTEETTVPAPADSAQAQASAQSGNADAAPAQSADSAAPQDREQPVEQEFDDFEESAQDYANASDLERAAAVPELKTSESNGGIVLPDDPAQPQTAPVTETAPETESSAGTGGAVAAVVVAAAAAAGVVLWRKKKSGEGAQK